MTSQSTTTDFDGASIFILSLAFPIGAYLVQRGFIMTDWTGYGLVLVGMLFVIFAVALFRGPHAELLGIPALLLARAYYIGGGFSLIDFKIKTGLSGLFFGHAGLAAIVVLGGLVGMAWPSQTEQDQQFLGNHIKGAIGSRGLSILVSLALAGSLFFLYALWNIPLAGAPKRAGWLLSAAYWIGVHAAFLVLVLLMVRSLLVASMRLGLKRQAAQSDISVALSTMPGLTVRSVALMLLGGVIALGFSLYGGRPELWWIAYVAAAFGGMMLLFEWLFIAGPNVAMPRLQWQKYPRKPRMKATKPMRVKKDPTRSKATRTSTRADGERPRWQRWLAWACVLFGSLVSVLAGLLVNKQMSDKHLHADVHAVAPYIAGIVALLAVWLVWIWRKRWLAGAGWFNRSAAGLVGLAGLVVAGLSINNHFIEDGRYKQAYVNAIRRVVADVQNTCLAPSSQTQCERLRQLLSAKSGFARKFEGFAQNVPVVKARKTFEKRMAMFAKVKRLQKQGLSVSHSLRTAMRKTPVKRTIYHVRTVISNGTNQTFRRVYARWVFRLKPGSISFCTKPTTALNALKSHTKLRKVPFSEIDYLGVKKQELVRGPSYFRSAVAIVNYKTLYPDKQLSSSYQITLGEIDSKLACHIATKHYRLEIIAVE